MNIEQFCKVNKILNLKTNIDTRKWIAFLSFTIFQSRAPSPFPFPFLFSLSLNPSSTSKTKNWISGAEWPSKKNKPSAIPWTSSKWTSKRSSNLTTCSESSGGSASSWTPVWSTKFTLLFSKQKRFQTHQSPSRNDIRRWIHKKKVKQFTILEFLMVEPNKFQIQN